MSGFGIKMGKTFLKPMIMTPLGGGWEELFPCDFEERFSWGKSRDHGELWGREWSVVKNGKTWVELQIKSRESNTLFTKKIKIDSKKLLIIQLRYYLMIISFLNFT